MSSLFQYKIKTFWKQQTANKTANSKQRQHVFSHFPNTTFYVVNVEKTHEYLSFANEVVER